MENMLTIYCFIVVKVFSMVIEWTMFGRVRRVPVMIDDMRAPVRIITVWIMINGVVGYTIQRIVGVKLMVVLSCGVLGLRYGYCHRNTKESPHFLC